MIDCKRNFLYVQHSAFNSFKTWYKNSLRMAHYPPKHGGMIKDYTVVYNFMCM